MSARFATLGLLASLSLACSRSEPPTVRPEASAAKPAPAATALLEPGVPAPDFETTAHTGEVVKLSALRGKAIVLYFYPKDGTPGCTVEAQAFKSEAGQFASANAVVLGVSSDDSASHRSFAEEHGLPFLLLPDTEHAIAGAYGVGTTLGMPHRVTFLIDSTGKIAKTYPNVSPNGHAAEVLADLRALAPSAP